MFAVQINAIDPSLGVCKIQSAKLLQNAGALSARAFKGETMKFLRDLFRPEEPELVGKPVEGAASRKRVRENRVRDLAARKEALNKALCAEPSPHPAKLFYVLQKLSQYALELAMLDWRAGTDPRPYLSEIKGGFDIALDARPDILPSESNPGFIAVIASMMGWDLPFSHELPKEGDCEHDVICMDRWIIAGLYDRSCWSAKYSAPPLKNKFINKCLDDYWALLTEQVDCEDGVKRCIMNYERRATHQTFKGLPPIDAGGKYNELYLDYTLSAIMKKRKITSGTYHDWKWD